MEKQGVLGDSCSACVMGVGGIYALCVWGCFEGFVHNVCV